MVLWALTARGSKSRGFSEKYDPASPAFAPMIGDPYIFLAAELVNFSVFGAP